LRANVNKVTLLFADLKGSMELLRPRDPAYYDEKFDDQRRAGMQVI